MSQPNVMYESWSDTSLERKKGYKVFMGHWGHFNLDYQVKLGNY